MTRWWIASLTIDPRLWREHPVVDEGWVSRVRDAIGQLRGRVEGEVALVVVPALECTEWQLRLLEGEMFHLVMADEPQAEEEGQPRSPGVAWQKLMDAAQSINVQPGRGGSEADWRDCHVWLDEVAEIAVHVGHGAESTNHVPWTCCAHSVHVDVDSGGVAFFGLPDQGPLSDSTFAKQAATVFGSVPPASSADKIVRADHVASRIAPMFRSIQTGLLFLNLGPSVILAMGSALALSGQTVAVWKFAAALVASLSALALGWLSIKSRWVTARVFAEAGRSIQASQTVLGPLFPPVLRHLKRYAAIATSLALEAAASKGGGSPKSITELRDRYLEERVDDQINYYGGQAKGAKSVGKLVRWFFHVCTTLSLVSTSVALLVLLDAFPWISPEFSKRWVSGFATFVFPAFAAGAIGYLGLRESGRRVEYYQELHDELVYRKGILRRLESGSSIKEAVREMENLLLEEVAGWVRRRIF